MSEIDFALTNNQDTWSWISSVWYAERHFKQAIGDQTSFAGRIYHVLIGTIDLIPVVGRLASFAEKYIVEHLSRRHSNVNSNLAVGRVTTRNISSSQHLNSLSQKPRCNLASPERIKYLANKYKGPKHKCYAPPTRWNYLTADKPGGLFMFYDLGYPGYARNENGKICLVTDQIGFELRGVFIDIEDLTLEEKSYFIQQLSKVEFLDKWNLKSHSEYGRPYNGPQPKEKVELDLLAKLRASA